MFPLLLIVTIQLIVIGGGAWLFRHWMRRQADSIKARYTLTKTAFQIVFIAVVALMLWAGYSWFVEGRTPTASIPPLLILLVVLSTTRRRYQRILESYS